MTEIAIAPMIMRILSNKRLHQTFEEPSSVSFATSDGPEMVHGFPDAADRPLIFLELDAMGVAPNS